MTLTYYKFNIKLMKSKLEKINDSIKVSQIIKEDDLQLLMNKVVIVDSHWSPSLSSITRIENCIIRILPKATLAVKKCVLKNCIIVGFTGPVINVNGKHAVLTLDGLKGSLNTTGLSIIGIFDEISISNCNLLCLTDKSQAKKYTATNSQIINSMIDGTCETLNLSYTKITTNENNYLEESKIKVLYKTYFIKYGKSLWNKEIVQRANISHTIFDKVRINHYYLSTKCFDKETIDLSRAILIDDWSKLKKKYSGIKLYWVFLLTLTFLLPYLTKSFVLVLMTNIYGTKGLFGQIKLWELLLYDNNDNKLLFSLLTIILIIYNIGRFSLTMKIATLKEEENIYRDSNYQVVAIHPDKYKSIKIINKILNVLFIVSAGYSLFKLFQALNILVPNI